ncbi:RsfA family transcriptional regulator [Falsibacillus pallidus]|uniref:Prespore-specific regulator n=1 Tax=Falsibacillus pallidus TaxID=493781 RepID=A0A370GHX5_9BACI|nr:RsfA family transcriptional regulator [Falsibacillus pallidus]RDI41974.1 prespore-specific regulator [Falsibacillus pallidus]
MKTRQDAWTEENDLLLAETVLRHVREGSTQLNAFEEVGDKLNRTSAACGFRWNAVVRHQYEKALQLAKKQRKQRNRLLGKEQSGKKKLLYQPPTPPIEILDPVDYMAEEAEEFFESVPVEEHVESTTEEKTEEAAPAAKAPAYNEAPPAPQAPMMPSYQSPAPSSNGTMSLDKVIAYLHTLKTSHYQTEILKNENERIKMENNELKRRNQELENKIKQLENNTDIMQEDYETLMKIMNRARKLVLFEEEERPATKFKMDRNGNLEKVAE